MKAAEIAAAIAAMSKERTAPVATPGLISHEQQLKQLRATQAQLTAYQLSRNKALK